MQEKIPEFRFDGFTDTWEQRKLKEVARFNPKTELPERFEYIDLESVIGTQLIGHRTEERDSAPSRAQRLATPGDIFFQTVRPYQKNNYLFDISDGQYVFSTGYAQLKPTIDNRFLFSYIQRDDFVKNVLDWCTGTSYPAISSSDLSQISIMKPKNSIEQQSIGTFFSTLDHLITLQQRELDYLKETKKTMLSELFPKKSETIPGVRFDGFTDAWEQRKLGDVLSIPEPEKLQIPTPDSLMTVGLNLAGLRKGGNRETLSLGATNYFIRRSGQLIYGKQNFFNGSIALVTSEFDGMATSNDVPALNIDGDEVHRMFLYVFLARPSYYQSKEAYASGTGSKRIHEHTLFEFDISLPSLYEQKQVSSFFSTLDHLITLQQRKLDLLKSQKQTLLKSMFPR